MMTIISNYDRIVYLIFHAKSPRSGHATLLTSKIRIWEAQLFS